MTKIILKNVRLSFPSVFKTETYQGEDTGKYGATFLLPKSDKATKKAIDDSLPEILKKIKVSNIAQIPSDKIFIKDGDISDHSKYPEHAGNWVIRAMNTKKPTVINRDKTPITDDDNIIYSGCYVNAQISPWGFNKKSKGVSANLMGIQFVKDGDRLGAEVVASVDDFDAIDDDALFDDI